MQGIQMYYIQGTVLLPICNNEFNIYSKQIKFHFIYFNFSMHRVIYHLYCDIWCDL